MENLDKTRICEILDLASDIELWECLNTTRHRVGTLEQLRGLLDDGFIRPDMTYSLSPTAEEIYDFIKKWHGDFYFFMSRDGEKVRFNIYAILVYGIDDKKVTAFIKDYRTRLHSLGKLQYSDHGEDFNTYRIDWS